MPIQRVLVPIDFSDHSHEAARVAARIAKQHGAKLDLFHVSSVPEVVTIPGPEPGYLPHPLWTLLWEREEKRVQSKLNALEGELGGYGIKVDGDYNRGHIAETILDFAARKNSDLIVVGSHGDSGSFRYLIGSVAARLSRQAPCPVLVIKPNTTDSDESEPTKLAANGCFNRALLAVDYSEASTRCADYAQEFLGDDGVLELQHVWQAPPLPYLADDFASELENYRGLEASRLDKFAETVAIDPRRRRLYLDNGTPAKAIVDRAAADDVDLVVVGNHPRRGKEKVLGTTGDRVLRSTNKAVLVVHATGPDQRAAAYKQVAAS